MYLIRHAKSSWKEAGMDDFDRPLNERGRRDAPFMALHLKNSFPEPQAFLVSSAKRTRETFSYFKPEFPRASVEFIQVLYHSSPRTMEHYLNQLPSHIETVALIAHNPGISQAIDWFASEFREMPTCAIAMLEAEVDDWKSLTSGTCVLRDFLYPKQFKENNH